MSWVDVVAALIIYDFIKFTCKALGEGAFWLMSAIDEKLKEQEK